MSGFILKGMETQESGYEEKRYQAFIDERKLLLDAEREAARTFDKAVLTVASGSFVFSMAFVKELLATPIPHALWLLWLFWVLLAVVILMSLMSFLATQHACRRMIQFAEHSLQSAVVTPDAGLAVQGRSKQKDVWRRIIGVCNWGSVVVLVIALLVWIAFVQNNFVARRTPDPMAEKRPVPPPRPADNEPNEQTSFTPPPPPPPPPRPSKPSK